MTRGAWASWPDRHIAEQACTPRQLEVLKLKARGYGRRRGSITLGISPDTYRDHLAAALANVERHKRQQQAAA